MKVSILNGIVMGGGAGVSIHGSFRVATENSVIIFPISRCSVSSISALDIRDIVIFIFRMNL